MYFAYAKTHLTTQKVSLSPKTEPFTSKNQLNVLATPTQANPKTTIVEKIHEFSPVPKKQISPKPPLTLLSKSVYQNKKICIFTLCYSRYP